MQIQILKPFGPSIVKLKIPDEIINAMNDYTDKIIIDKQKLENLDHGAVLAGNVHQEFLLDVNFMKKIDWANFLAKVCSQWVKHHNGRELKDFKIIKSWIVRQFKNEYNPAHHHTGHISGVGYLKVPDNLGITSQKNKSVNQNGKLELIDTSPKLLCRGNYIIKPEVGDFYLFPAYLLHTVYPFSGSEDERRSVSFNAALDPLAASL
ncbi:putative 2OG-Fe(II) oxygenase [Candidatus Pelagibacter sp.]|nr:putative 2OG-Fe(II) oxygenase [Candidatus Pelagibacter sp.]